MNRRLYLIIITLVTAACIIAGCLIHFLPAAGSFRSGRGNSNSGTDLSSQIQSGSSTEELAFDSISLKIQAAEITVKGGSGYNISCSGRDELQPEVQLEGSTLSVVQDTSLSDITLKGNGEAHITITVPEETELSRISADINIGETELENLDIGTLEITDNTGEITVKDCRIGTAAVTGGIGEIDLENVSCEEMTLSVNTGDVEVKKTDFESLDITANIGDIEIKAVRDLNEYSMDLSANTGEIEVDDSDRGRAYSVQGTGVASIKASVNIGDISVE